MFLVFLLGARVCLASVSVDDVLDVINVSSTEVPDAKVLKMVKRAEVTLETGDWLRNGLQPNKEKRTKAKKDRYPENHPRPHSAHVRAQTQLKQ